MPGRSEIEAGRAFVRLFLKDEMTRNLVRAVQGVGKRVAVIGGVVSAAGGAITGAFSAAVKSFADAGDVLDKTSARTGVSASALAELGFAAEQSGTTMEMVEKGLFGLSRALFDAKRESAEAVDSLAELGLMYKDLEGLSPEDQFQTVADALANVEDMSLRGAIAQKLLGRSGRQLLPMLERLRDLRGEARGLGIVPEEKDVTNAAKVTDAINRVRRVLGAMVFEIGASLADSVLAGLEAVKNIAVSIGGWIKENKALIKTIAAVGAGLLVAGTAITAAGTALIGLGFAISAVGTIVGTILSPLGLITAALVAGVAAWVKWTETGRAAVAGIASLLGELSSIAKNTFQGIFDAIAAGDLKLAGEIAFTGLKLAAIKGLDALRGLVGDAVVSIIGRLASGDISGAWSDTLKQLSLLWATWSEGVVKMFTGAARSILAIWQRVVTFVTRKILELATLPGFDKAFEAYSGVNVREEMARTEKLNRMTGRNQGSFLDRAAKDAGGIIADQADQIEKIFDEIDAGAEHSTRKAAAAAVKSTEEGIRAISDAARIAGEELDALTKRAAEKRAAVAAGRAAGAGGPAIELPGAAGGEGTTPGLVTFSAAGAMAAGFGGRGGPQEQMVRHLGDIARAGRRAEAQRRAQLAKDDEMIRKIEDMFPRH